jgi:hypothetical protein
MIKVPFLRFRQLSTTTKLLLFITVLLLVATLIIANSILSSRPETQPHARVGSPAPSHAAGVSPTPPYVTSGSPLIFGTNLDNHISSIPQAQVQAKQLDLQTMRLGDTSDG